MTRLDALFDDLTTVKWGPGKDSVDIIDQSLLPGTLKRIQLHTAEEMWEAIKKLKVRGAPAIGIMAAFATALLANQIATEDYEIFVKQCQAITTYLATSRPTAVNLFWALDRMQKLIDESRDLPVSLIKDKLVLEAESIQAEDITICRNIGEIGFSLLSELKGQDREIGILTHCNAGTLATGKYGTATAPMYMALEHGWPGDAMHVYCDETRPLLQGARLTAFELSRAGIQTTLQCDNMAAVLMAQGKIQLVFVGCDRVARNGDTANKIGTNTVAILAKHYGIPFYVCAPSSTIDMATPTGADIPIELRAPQEISDMWYRERMTAEQVNIFNPAFDVTDHSLITGIITDKGLCHAPFDKSFLALGLS